MSGLGALAPYNDELLDLLTRVVGGDRGAVEAAALNLDGKASAEFRRLVPLPTRRTAGTFFTGSALRTRVVARYRAAIAAGVHTIDPACGLGDLLLAAADQLPASWSSSRRVAHVRNHLHGRDLHAPLVEVAAARLAVWSALAGKSDVSPEHSPVLVGNAFADDLDWDRFGLILLNPPYATERIEATDWGEGHVTAAAPFTLNIVRRARPGARIAAILPDVLRSGARYNRWRSEIERRADLVSIDVVGLFDKWTDVDVFVAHLRRHGSRRSRRQISWFSAVDPGTPKLGDQATLAVGDVVPHRDVPSGPESPYLTVDALPAWATTLQTPLTVCHAGRLHEPPFVVLRRTSAPTRTPGAIRARAAVYAGPGPVAVENHLIVVRPMDGELESCMRLWSAFQRPEVTTWLDQRLRLRHLTVTALRDLPLAFPSAARIPS